jgi:hypothetical protein
MNVTLGTAMPTLPTTPKCAIVVNHSLPLGLAANAAAVVSASLGRAIDGLIGPDASDASGRVFPGVVTVPLPILAASAYTIASIVGKAAGAHVVAVPFTTLAQSCRTYEEYVEKLGVADADHLAFAAVGLVGSADAVAKLTASLPLLR